MLAMYRTISILFLATYSGLCHAQSTTSSLAVSQDGSCGEASNSTCLGSTFGSCCSLKGFCGATNDFCNPTAGCQSSFGSCSTNTSFISYDGKCGSTDPNSQVCIGSTYGSCCSQKGWCGATADYCGVGCQSAFGTCGGANSTVDTNTDAAPSGTAATSSSISATPTSMTTGSSSTSGADSSTSDVSRSRSSEIGYKIAIGLLCGLLAVLSVIIAMLLLRRRIRQSPAAHNEKSGEASTTCACGGPSFIEAQYARQHSMKGATSSFISTPGSLKQQPAELGNTGHGRAELNESCVELNNQKG